MAPSLGRKRLACYCCGVKSSTRQDGSVRQWECKNCESVNYVDQNGNIMDPPSSSFSPDPSPPPILRYARKVDEPVFDTFDKPPTDDSPFCGTCLKNQHMYNSFISSYEPEHMGVDPARPYAPDRKFLEYKKNLEARYPQVCADCQRGVDERIRKANRMAQAEVLRHKLDRTKIVQGKGRSRTWVEVFALCGGIIYWAATVCQVTVCVFGILRGTLPTMSDICAARAQGEDDLPIDSPVDSSFPLYLAATASFVACFVQWMVGYGARLGTGLPSLESMSILLTLASFWWNPYYRNMIRGFDRHIHGFLDWYRYQVILLVTRVVFWSIVGKGQFSRDDASSTMGLHCFMLGFTLFIARISRQSIKVDFRKLFPQPKEYSHYNEETVSAAQTSVYRGDGMADILDDIATEPARRNNGPYRDQALTPARSQRISSQETPIASQSTSPTGYTQPKVSLSAMSPDEATRYLLHGEVPAHIQVEIDDGEMEWTPTQNSELMQFDPRPRQVPQSSSVHAAPADQNPFWHKVPAAPLAPGQKIGRPFQKPLFQSVSEEKKENFFNRMTGRKSSFGETTSNASNERRTMDMAPPKFFAQTAFEVTGLEDLMESAFSLKSDTPSKVPAISEASNTSRKDSHYNSAHISGNGSGLLRQADDWKLRLLYIAVLALSFGGWNLGFNSEALETKKVSIGIIVVCLALALRTLTDNTVTDWAKQNPGMRTALATTAGGLQAAFAGYLGLDILLAPELDPNWQSKGGILIGGMLVQEIWLLLF